MPLNPKAKRFEVPMSPEQHTALVAEAQAQGYTSTAKYVRDVLAEYVPDFKADDMQKRGKYQRKKCAWCGHITSHHALDCPSCNEENFTQSKIKRRRNPAPAI